MPSQLKRGNGKGLAEDHVREAPKEAHEACLSG